MHVCRLPAAKKLSQSVTAGLELDLLMIATHGQLSVELLPGQG